MSKRRVHGATRNDVTGQRIISKSANAKFREGFDNIKFGVNKPGDGLVSTQVKAEGNS